MLFIGTPSAASTHQTMGQCGHISWPPPWSYRLWTPKGLRRLSICHEASPKWRAQREPLPTRHESPKHHWKSREKPLGSGDAILPMAKPTYSSNLKLMVSLFQSHKLLPTLHHERVEIFLLLIPSCAENWNQFLMSNIIKTAFNASTGLLFPGASPCFPPLSIHSSTSKRVYE